eukprot:530504-Hanusia_phi.AAC.1
MLRGRAPRLAGGPGPHPLHCQADPELAEASCKLPSSSAGPPQNDSSPHVASSSPLLVLRPVLFLLDSCRHSVILTSDTYRQDTGAYITDLLLPFCSFLDANL